MNPDVARALGDIRDRGLLTESRAALLQRIYEGKLVSVLPELRVLLYGGVVLAAAGAGLLVKDNFHRIGPAAVAVALALAIAGCFLWIARVAPPFDWREVPSPNLAFDYILLLAVLLTGTELAFVETQFTPLGPNWPWHLLIMSLLSAAVAFRFDSRAVFSLPLLISTKCGVSTCTQPFSAALVLVTDQKQNNVMQRHKRVGVLMRTSLKDERTFFGPNGREGTPEAGASSS